MQNRRHQKVLHQRMQKRLTRQVQIAPAPYMRQNPAQQAIVYAGKKVCVIRSVGGIGDVLMATPCLRELKYRYPDCHLTFAIDRHRTDGDIYYELVKNAPFIDEIVDARFVDKDTYDVVLNISSVCIAYESSGQPPKNRIDIFANHLGFQEMNDYVPFYEVTLEEKMWAQVYIQKCIKERSTVSQKLVALHIASNDPRRCWSTENNISFIELALQRSPHILFFIFDYNNPLTQWVRYENVVDVSLLTIRQKAAIINQMDLFVGPDSGLMHLAGALCIPSFALFGPIPPLARINHYKSCEAITSKAFPCKCGWYKACKYDHQCMTTIDVEHVLYKSNLFLSAIPAKKCNCNSCLISSIRLRVGYWSTWQVACGIAVYTEHLVKALSYHGATVFPYSNKLSITELLDAAIRDRINVLNIEYEPAIMPKLPELLELINKLQRRNIKIVITFHSEPEGTEQLVAAADQVIFHKIPTRAIIGDKVNHLSMGVPVFEPNGSRDIIRSHYGFTPQDKILATTGFMFTWKQHADLLERLVPLLNSDPSIKIQLLTAFNDVNPKECSVEEAKIKAIIDVYRLHNQVTHITSFLSQYELSERLWLSDLGYLWSGLTTTSSSAASKEFITARLPVVITDSNHYHDMQTGVIRTPMDKSLFTETICTSLKNNNLLEILRRDLDAVYKELNYNNNIFKHSEVLSK